MGHPDLWLGSRGRFGAFDGVAATAGIIEADDFMLD